MFTTSCAALRSEVMAVKTEWSGRVGQSLAREADWYRVGGEASMSELCYISRLLTVSSHLFTVSQRSGPAELRTT